MLTRVAQDAERALEAVEQAEGLLGDEQVKAAHDLLRELIGQDFDIDQDGVPRLHRGTRGDRIISTVDTGDAPWPQEQPTALRWLQASAAATNAQRAADHGRARRAGGEQDGPQAKHLIDASAAKRRPRAGARRHRLWERAGPRRAGRARRRGARAGARRQVRGGQLCQARLRDRPGERHGHLPRRDTVADRHLTSAAFAARLLHGRCVAPVRSSTAAAPDARPSESAISERTAAPPRAKPSPTPPRRASARPTTDRTAARPARPPLRRSQEPLHRQRKSRLQASGPPRWSTSTRSATASASPDRMRNRQMIEMTRPHGRS